MNKRLFESFMTPCVMLDRTSTSTPTGPAYSWTEGAKFNAAIIKNKTLAARVAEAQGVTEIYTITTPPDVALDYHDAIKRLEDGAIFRVTSNTIDSSTPEIASFQFSQVSAERWQIPK